MALSEETRKKLIENMRKCYRKLCILRRFNRSTSRMKYEAFTDLNELVNGDADITIERIMEIYKRSGLSAMDRIAHENILRGLAFLFVCKVNQEERNTVLSYLAKEAAIEEAQEIA